MVGSGDVTFIKLSWWLSQVVQWTVDFLADSTVTEHDASLATDDSFLSNHEPSLGDSWEQSTAAAESDSSIAQAYPKRERAYHFSALNQNCKNIIYCLLYWVLNGVVNPYYT